MFTKSDRRVSIQVTRKWREKKRGVPAPGSITNNPNEGTSVLRCESRDLDNMRHAGHMPKLRKKIDYWLT